MVAVQDNGRGGGLMLPDLTTIPVKDYTQEQVENKINIRELHNLS